MQETVYIIVLVDNDVELIEDTFRSVTEQSYPIEEIKVLFVDNCSTDGSYEKILSYICEYPALFSVYRMKERTKTARMIKAAVNYLRDEIVSYTVYLMAGDILYRDFIQKTVNKMHLIPSASALFANVDIEKNGKLIKQQPIFTDNSFFDKREDFVCLFQAGINAKVQTIYRGIYPYFTDYLKNIEMMTDIHDWLSYVYPYRGKIIYLQDTAGIAREKETDLLTSLMIKAYSLKSVFNVYEIQNVNRSVKSLDQINMDAGYCALAKKALVAAIEEGEKGNYSLVRKCLIFAEMLYLPIVEEELYIGLKNAADEQKMCDNVKKYKIVNPCRPPLNSILTEI